jgi:hypothetical protein
MEAISWNGFGAANPGDRDEQANHGDGNGSTHQLLLKGRDVGGGLEPSQP